MFKGVDHVVVAVKDLDTGIKTYENLFGTKVEDVGEPAGAGFKNAYFRFGSTFLEVISPSGEGGPVAKRVAASGDGVYLLALAVDDIDKTIEELRGKGVRLIGDPGPGNKATGQVFIHPASANGVLTQIVQR
jgi:methylmalonyl-CoA epimerase